MDQAKIDKITRQNKEQKELISLIEWHERKCFVFADIKIETSHPMHSQLLAVFQSRLKYIESELEGME